MQFRLLSGHTSKTSVCSSSGHKLPPLVSNRECSNKEERQTKQITSVLQISITDINEQLKKCLELFMVPNRRVVLTVTCLRACMCVCMCVGEGREHFLQKVRHMKRANFDSDWLNILGAGEMSTCGYSFEKTGGHVTA